MATRKGETLFIGLIILIIGTLFMVRNLGWDLDIWELVGKLWPLILIYIGVKNIYIYLQRKK